MIEINSLIKYEIINNNCEVPDVIPESAGVYFFFDNDKTLVYIGTAYMFLNRLRNHSLRGKYKYISFLIENDKIKRYALEKAYIQKHRPILNLQQYTKSPPKPAIISTPVTETFQSISPNISLVFKKINNEWEIRGIYDKIKNKETKMNSDIEKIVEQIYRGIY